MQWLQPAPAFSVSRPLLRLADIFFRSPALQGALKSFELERDMGGCVSTSRASQHRYSFGSDVDEPSRTGRSSARTSVASEGALSPLSRRSSPNASTASSPRVDISSLARLHVDTGSAASSRPRSAEVAQAMAHFIRELENYDSSGRQPPVAAQDARWQSEIVAAQNRLHPQLKLKTFDLSDSDFGGFNQAVAQTKSGTRWRALLNIDRGFDKDIPKHVVAVDVSAKRGTRSVTRSVIAVDSLWGGLETQRIVPKAVRGLNTSVTLLNTGIQKGPVGCAVFAVEIAKAMAGDDSFFTELHATNGKGPSSDEGGVKFTVKNGRLLLPASFLKHVTSKNVLENFPEEVRAKIRPHFDAHFRSRTDEKGNTVEYSNSIEKARISLMKEALEHG